jgi:hypothetical protein
MPDEAGNIRGITVPAEAWERIFARDCISCGEERPRNECPKSLSSCGHHCNHSWTHDICDWCGKKFGEATEGL